MQVYEFVGYLNTPDECNGKWFEDFPYDFTGKPVKPRIEYKDISQGTYVNNNWQAYVISGEVTPSSKYVNPSYQKLGDYITNDPIQRIRYSTIKKPRYWVVKGQSHAIQSLECDYNELIEWHVDTVRSFETADGKIVYSTFEEVV